MKTSTRVFAVVLGVLGLVSTAMSQPGTAPHRIDLKASQLHDGPNQIGESGGLKLIAVVSGGKITGFQVKDQAGNNAKGTMRKAAAPTGGGGPDKLCKAEICVRNKDGGKECWVVYVDCKIVDTLPKGAKL